MILCSFTIAHTFKQQIIYLQCIVKILVVYLSQALRRKKPPYGGGGEQLLYIVPIDVIGVLYVQLLNYLWA